MSSKRVVHTGKRMDKGKGMPLGQSKLLAVCADGEIKILPTDGLQSFVLSKSDCNPQSNKEEGSYVLLKG